VEDAIDSWRPRGVPPETGVFARQVVQAASPRTPGRARSLLWAASRLAAFGISVGLSLSPEVLLRDSVIERFVVLGMAEGSPAGQRSLRTNLRFLASYLDRAGGPSPISLPRQRAKTPYSEAELYAYFALADAQPTLSRRMRTTGLLCLGAGAGIVGAELRGIRGTHVSVRSGGVVVEVAGAHPRCVPVRVEFHPSLLLAAGFAGDGFIVGGEHPARRNVTGGLVASLSGGADLPRLDTGRLRSTWLARCATDLGIKAFLDAAGITCSQRLGDLVATLPAVDESTAVVLLGGVTSDRMA
jgi:integrase